MASSSINLRDQTDCDWWKEQSVCLIESHGMQNVFLDVRLNSTKENGDSKKKADKAFVKRKRSDVLVILIYGSLGEVVICTAFGIHKTNDVWEKLDANYKYSSKDHLQGTGNLSNYGIYKRAQGVKEQGLAKRRRKVDENNIYVMASYARFLWDADEEDEEEVSSKNISPPSF
ncbi:ankyrin repeat-containing domain, PGG domain, Gag-polypeptide of LTR copia-type [Artemisia annua]|uniref:Ankyrin repeat-containing domain, PGG domain, Gag-polypeptide of LTR copia-type n=1 Tax=Artemisia annua TaxID=35608 RepID=A0A2U1PGN6_ARTAN|nr:ankyrin repeat-containing domain, PGG domain, Gag-polypeptide of LTR copia-type [Artemisia annua]